MSKNKLGRHGLIYFVGQTVVFIIAATTGDGAPPDHALPFQKDLHLAMQDKKQPLSGLAYSVLALGSSSYAKFCEFGIYLDNAMQIIGGTQLTPLVKADACHGQDQSFNRWAVMSLCNACQFFKVNVDNEAKKCWPFVPSNLVGREQGRRWKRLALNADLRGEYMHV